MIYTVENFFNKAAKDIRAAYFPDENHGYTHNERYHAVSYTIELFNNGCLSYPKFIGKLAKNCNDTRYNIHSLIEKHIVSFGSYEYKPKK